MGGGNSSPKRGLYIEIPDDLKFLFQQVLAAKQESMREAVNRMIVQYVDENKEALLLRLSNMTATAQPEAEPILPANVIPAQPVKMKRK